MADTRTLPGPEDVNTEAVWLLPVAEGADPVAVEGRFLGMSSSRRTEHNRRIVHPGGFAEIGGNCSTCRWSETRIFREAAGGYAVHRIGRSVVPGETLRCRGVERVRTPYEVVETLTSRVAGSAYLTRMPAMALAQCSAHDVPLRDAYENRAVS